MTISTPVTASSTAGGCNAGLGLATTCRSAEVLGPSGPVNIKGTSVPPS